MTAMNNLAEAPFVTKRSTHIKTLKSSDKDSAVATTFESTKKRVLNFISPVDMKRQIKIYLREGRSRAEFSAFSDSAQVLPGRECRTDEKH